MSVKLRRTTLIAEIGENHLGELSLAKSMIEQAAKAGADIVKFQSYLGADVSADDPEREWFTQVELSDAMHQQFKQQAEILGVGFLSSPFTVERARYLCEVLKLDAIKIASSEMLNFQLLDYVNKHAKQVYLSTGLATLEEVQDAVSHLTGVEELTILHCTTQYPTQDEEANLNVISTLRDAFPDQAIGYSDHTLGIEAALAAVTLGAQVIEKHFTLAKTLPGTDHVLSATPEEFSELVKQVRRLEKMLGSDVKVPVQGEEAIKSFVRNRWKKDSV